MDTRSWRCSVDRNRFLLRKNLSNKRHIIWHKKCAGQIVPSISRSTAVRYSFFNGTKAIRYPGGVLGSSFAGYVPLASQNPYLIMVYSVASYRPHLGHFWGNVIVISRTELNASRLLNIKTTAGTIFQPRIFLFLNPCLPEFSYPKKPENLRPHSSNSTKIVTHYSQSSCKNATPSSGTSPVVFY